MQQDRFDTFSETASRHSQRIVNFIAASRPKWVLWACDVGSAFLKGPTFQDVAEMTGEPLRIVQLDLPKDTVQIARQFGQLADYDPSQHCLEVVRPGFGPKDAPRLWDIRLKQCMTKLQLLSLVADPQFYCKWSGPRYSALPRESVRISVDDDEDRFSTFTDPKMAIEDLQLVCSTHVDDLKGASNEKIADAFMDALESEFGKLTRRKRKSEHCGVVHEQREDGSVWCSQDHYATQLRPTPVKKARYDDEQLEHQDRMAYLSLLGDAAWTLVTRADVAVHIGYLQRHAHEPCWKHVRHLNSVVRWMKRKSSSFVYYPVPLPWSVDVFPVSAFRATEPDCLAVRAAVIVIAGVDFMPEGGLCAAVEF